MTKFNLKSIIGKKNDASALLLSVFEQMKADVFIEDEKGKILLGNQMETFDHQFPVVADNENIGWVKGNEKANTVADLLSHLAQKESEKKKLGSEVLTLYQDMNMIFNFSEKLAQTIDPPTIAKTTLDEALHLIKSDNGVVVLWDENSRTLKVVASSGDLFFNEEKINSHRSLLLNIVLSGQSEIIGDISALANAEIILPQVNTVLYAALKVNQRVMGAIILARNELIQYTAADLKLLTTLTLQSSSAIEAALLYEKNIREVKEREEAILKIHEVTKKFVPHEFIRSLGKDVLTDVKLGDQAEKIVTVLFTDIREYTTMAEKMTPEENFKFVCAFNEQIGPIIRKYEGFINQYLGDAIMAIFPGKADSALAAAIEIQKKVQEFNADRTVQEQSPVKIGIGMHTGSLIMGIIGDEHRMDAATISDTVNTASRIESLTKYYKSPLLLSEETWRMMKNPEQFDLRNLGSFRLKGKHLNLNIIECINGFDRKSYENKKSTLSIFAEAMNSYKEQRFENAIRLFQSVLAIDPDDLTSQFFIDKAMHYLREGVPENWSGVEEMMSK